MARAISVAAALAGAATLLVAVPSQAAEPFSGAYVGIQTGWQRDSSQVSVTNSPTTVLTKSAKSGVEYGAQLGYDLRSSDQFVVGAEAFVSGVTGDMDYPGAARLKAGRSFGLLARAGVLATPQTLVYGTGGWENARFGYKVGSTDVSKNRDGWTLGAGIEQMLMPNVSARVEYRYSRFGDKGFSDLDSLTGGTTKLRDTRNRILVGVNYRF